MERIHLLADDLERPDWPEERVLEWEEKMRDVVWNAGYRKVVEWPVKILKQRSPSGNCQP